MTATHLDADVVVVGAGPAGSATARDIARAGFQVILLEEHGEVGRPVHCSGLVTPRTLALAEVDEDIVVNRIRGAYVHTPSGHTVVIGGDRVHALVIDRCQLDQRLAGQAQAAGATLQMNTRLVGVQQRAGGVVVEVQSEGDRHLLHSRLVVGADGSNSALARLLGMAASQERVVAVGGEARATPLSGDFVEVFVGPQVAPGWFGWGIPAQPGTVRLGIGSSQPGANPRALLRNMLESWPHLAAGDFLGLQGGLIPLQRPLRTYDERVLLVGDAAGQVKPTSGGGIYTSLAAAKWCSQVSVEALERDQFSRAALARYEEGWSGELGRELTRGAALRKALLALDAHEVDALVSVLGREPFKRIVSQEGDIDFPSRLFSRLLRPGPVFLGALWVPPCLWPKLALLAWHWYRDGERGLSGRRGRGASL